MRLGIILDNELNSDIRVLREIRILKDQGHELFILCFAFRKGLENPLPGITVERIYLPRKIKDGLFFLLNTLPVYEWMWSRKINRFVKNHNIEAVHAHDLYMSRATYQGVKKNGSAISLVLDLHENYPFTVRTYNWTKGFFRSRIAKPERWSIKEYEYLSLADRIIVLSEDFREILLGKYQGLKRENFYVVPNVPDIASTSQGHSQKAETPFTNAYPLMLYYGVIAERRGVFDAINAFSELATHGVRLNFLLIGPVDKKDRERFLAEVARPELEGIIYHIPWIDATALPSYLAISDICIAPFHKNPQHESGVANKIYDYMLGERPLIVSDCRPQKELVEKHNCGLVFNDNQAMKAAIVKLVSDPDLRGAMGKNGRQAIHSYYNSSVIKDELKKLYNSLT